MAINKTINKRTNTHGAMRNCIEYVLRQDKTSELLTYVTGPYCHDEINYDLVYRTFLEEKKMWDKDSGRMYAHNIISWHKDEQITPEQALEFGKEFAENWFSGFQTLMAVHKDKDHIHCHLVTNSVSYEDGRKLHNTKKDLERMKQLTNQMCRERGLTVVEKGKHFDGSQIEKGEVIAWSKDKYNLFRQQVKDSFVADCAMAVLKALENCISKEKFIEKMKQFGWSVNWTEKRKHITFQNQDGKKVRDSNLSKTFHLDISKEGLENEFNGNREKSKVAADRDSRSDEELRNYYRELDAAIADTRGITNQAQSGEGYSRTEFRESERVHANTEKADTDTGRRETDDLIRQAEIARRSSEINRRNSAFVKNGVLFETVIKNITRGAQIKASVLDEIVSDKPTNMQYLMLANLQDGIISDELPYLKGIDSKYEKYCIKNGSLVISKNASPVKMAIASVQEGNKILANGNLYVIELDEDKINPYFLKAYLESENGKAALSRVAVGATLLNLPVEGLKKVIIPLPDLESQKKIADQYYAKLSEIKELKYKLEKATEELEHIYTEEK